MSELCILFKFNDSAECFGIQACPADQRAVDIRHFHELRDIVRLYASAIQNSDGVGERCAKIFFNQRPDIPMDLLGLIRGGRFAGADGPNRFIGDDQGA